MLAYVFWHWPRPEIDRGQYLDHLTEFHRTLAANKPPGFQRSVVFRIQGANWLNTDGEAFEELAIGHAPHHEPIVFAVHLEVTFRHFDGASMRGPLWLRVPPSLGR